MSDIVVRLRDKHCCDASKCNCDEAADEIEKLRARGCARDQTTTQYCAEVIERDAEIEKLRAALQTARRDALEEAMEIAFKERFCVERYETSPPQAVAAHNIIEAIRALGEKE